MRTLRTSTHPAVRISTVWLLLSLTGAADACGSDSGGNAEPQAGAGGSAAAGSGGSAAGGGADQGEPELGAACARDADCSGGYVCDEEVRMSVGVQGAPGGTVDQILFLGGSCTPLRVTAYDGSGSSCDPTEPVGSQGCGSDGVCDAVAQNSSSVFVGCRKACDPAAQDTGCRQGYDCDFSDKYCVEGCQTDADCRIVAIDSDGDGTPDARGYDSASAVTCDPSTSRCVHPAGSQAFGQSCMRDDDCPENGVCIVEEAQIAGQSFPGGYCTRRGCQYSGNECGSDAVCESLRPWLGASPTEKLCLQSCKVGAESADLRLGAKGHGAGCREGYRCHYNGASGGDSGACVGGNYNDVMKNNVGSQCKTNADCYSPFGLGYCLVYQVSSSESLPGICTLFDCAVPGFPTDLCGDGNECVATGDGDETNCQHHCTDATACPEGFACTDDDGDEATPKNCIPPCLTDADCRSGEKCILVSSSSRAGLCRLQ